MAIEQIPLNRDAAQLNAFLKTLVPEFLSEVSDPDESGEFLCKDVKGHPVLRWITLSVSQRAGFRMETSEETLELFTVTKDDFMNPYYAMRMKHGAVLRFADKSASPKETCQLLITKNNLGNTCFVLSAAEASYGLERNLQNFQCVSYEDRSPVIGRINLSPVLTETQTVFVPFVSCGPKDLNTPSATVHAFFLPYRQFTKSCTLVVNGVKYWTNGIWALEDES